MGSSYDACYPAVTELAQAGVTAVMLDAAELLHFRTAMLGSRTILVAVSQSGESAEVVRAVREVRARPAEQPHVVAVTNGVTNTLAGLADLALDTHAGQEAGPSTMTFAASLVLVAAVGRAIAGAAGARPSSRTCATARRWPRRRSSGSWTTTPCPSGWSPGWATARPS